MEDTGDHSDHSGTDEPLPILVVDDIETDLYQPLLQGEEDMLLMTADYASARNAKAERTMEWLVGNMRVKPFATPKITAIDVAAADAEPAQPRARRARARREVEAA